MSGTVHVHVYGDNHCTCVYKAKQLWPTGHTYDCFPTGSNCIYLYVCVTCVLYFVNSKEVVSFWGAWSSNVQLSYNRCIGHKAIIGILFSLKGDFDCYNS